MKLLKTLTGLRNKVPKHLWEQLQKGAITYIANESWISILQYALKTCIFRKYANIQVSSVYMQFPLLEILTSPRYIRLVRHLNVLAQLTQPTSKTGGLMGMMGQSAKQHAGNSGFPHTSQMMEHHTPKRLHTDTIVSIKTSRIAKGVSYLRGKYAQVFIKIEVGLSY